MRRLALVGLLALSLVPAALAFTPNDPLYARQWYLVQDHAFDLWPDALPPLAPVRVAIVDSGIDVGHPEFAGKIVATKSFVGGDITDHDGHGTFVAGEIAAAVDNGQGIAGIAFTAQLVIAKVVASDGTILPAAEASAIRWAADQGARVINLSLGGLRDPLDTRRDTYSSAEEAAIEYAVAKGAVVIAAIGNGDEAPSTPWNYASYPSALPHVIGVSALSQDGSVPSFSNRDAIFNDIAAPGDGILSTLPRALTAARPTCADQGYSDCGPFGYRNAQGTSFASAQVSGAAALLLATRPELTGSQVGAILEHSAADMNTSNGCRQCTPGRDRFTGWGRLDVSAALQALQNPLPPADHFESNDNAGTQAATLYGRQRVINATIDFWDDQVDVYRVRLRAGEHISATLAGPPGTRTGLILWKPGTQRVEGLSVQAQSQRATQSADSGPNARLAYRAPLGGWYYLEVKLSAPGSGAYTLHFSKS